MYYETTSIALNHMSCHVGRILIHPPCQRHMIADGLTMSDTAIIFFANSAGRRAQIIRKLRSLSRQPASQTVILSTRRQIVSWTVGALPFFLTELCCAVLCIVARGSGVGLGVVVGSGHAFPLFPTAQATQMRKRDPDDDERQASNQTTVDVCHTHHHGTQSNASGI